MAEESTVQVESKVATLVEPDLEFIREVKKTGGDTLKKCFQCATCSVVCALSPQDNPFPRKEMMWVQWGLKDKLVSDVDIWLCHQCADCSDRCPRGAKPGMVLAALRNYVFSHYSPLGFMGKLVNQAKFLPVVLALPVVLLLIVISLGGGLGFPAGEEVDFAKWIDPTFGVDVIFVPFSVLAIVLLLVGLRQFSTDIHERALRDGWAKKETFTLSELIRGFIGVLYDIISHNRFKECTANQPRYLYHVLVFHGFISLAVVTGLVAAFFWADKLGIASVNIMLSPLPLINPVKWLANIGGLATLVGIILMAVNWVNQRENMGRGGYPDWALILIIMAVVITGFLAQFFRLTNVASVAYPMYFIHLVVVFWLIAYVPYSKLAHLAYRTVAMAYARHQGREMMSRAMSSSTVDASAAQAAAGEEPRGA